MFEQYRDIVISTLSRLDEQRHVAPSQVREIVETKLSLHLGDDFEIFVIHIQHQLRKQDNANTGNRDLSSKISKVKTVDTSASKKLAKAIISNDSDSHMQGSTGDVSEGVGRIGEDLDPQSQIDADHNLAKMLSEPTMSRSSRTGKPFGVSASAKKQKKAKPVSLISPNLSLFLKKIDESIPTNINADGREVMDVPENRVIQLLWTYIKRNNLQDTSRKRVIRIDEQLQNVLGVGVAEMEMFEMTKLISTHITVLTAGSSSRKKVKVIGNTFNSLMTLSGPLSELLGETRLSRPQCVKVLWVYIKAHDLQVKGFFNLKDPADKRMIICDNLMAKVFGVKKVSMFKMNQLLSSHLMKSEEADDFGGLNSETEESGSGFDTEVSAKRSAGMETTTNSPARIIKKERKIETLLKGKKIMDKAMIKNEESNNEVSIKREAGMDSIAPAAIKKVKKERKIETASKGKHLLSKETVSESEDE